MPLGWIFATLGTVLLGAVLLRQQSYRPPPEPAPLAAPTPAPLPAPDMIIDGYWLGIGLGCHSDRAYALYIRTHLTDSLDRLFPEAARERARAQFEQGVRRGGLAGDGLACERGLATLDRVRLPIMLTR